MAKPPNFVAESEESLPVKDPIAVLLAATI